MLKLHQAISMRSPFVPCMELSRTARKKQGNSRRTVVVGVLGKKGKGNKQKISVQLSTHGNTLASGREIQQRRGQRGCLTHVNNNRILAQVTPAAIYTTMLSLRLRTRCVGCTLQLRRQRSTLQKRKLFPLCPQKGFEGF